MNLRALGSFIILGMPMSGYAGECAPATLTFKDRTPIEGIFVQSETMEKVVYFLADPKSQQSPCIELPHDKYLAIQWAGPEDGHLLGGQSLFDQGEWEKALACYRRSITSAKWSWEIELSLLRAAECLSKLNRPDAALAVLKECSDRFPSSIHQPELVTRRADLRSLTNDRAGAEADYRKLVEAAPLWGGTCWRDGLIGQHRLLRQQKKFADALALLMPQFATLAPAEQPEDFAAIGLAIADDLESAGRAGDALATCKRIYLSPLPPGLQAQAHLKAARLFFASDSTTSLLTAFDHVALAAVMSGDEDTAAAARRLGREIAARIEKNPEISAADRLEYRTYVLKF